MKKKPKLISVLPDYLSYRLNEYIELSKTVEIEFIVGKQGTGIRNCEPEFKRYFKVNDTKVKRLFNKVFYQTGTIKSYLFSNYDYFFIQAHFRYIDFWLILILNLVLRKSLILHGQGLYRFKKTGFLRAFLFKIINASCKKYICYNEYCLNDLKDKGLATSKFVFLNNIIREDLSLTLSDSCCTKYSSDILYIGRLRDRTGIDLFIEAFKNHHFAIEKKLHIIGDGENLPVLKKKYSSCSNIIFHGAIIDDSRIREISKNCSFGIYPGDTGLSIVHYAALGLIPIFHNEFRSHMGPEFSLFEELFSKITFTRNDMEEALVKIADIELDKERIQKDIEKIYKDSLKDSFGSKFLTKMSEGIF